MQRLDDTYEKQLDVWTVCSLRLRRVSGEVAMALGSSNTRLWNLRLGHISEKRLLGWQGKYVEWIQRYNYGVL